MSNENVDLIRRAYGAYTRGDVRSFLQLVDPELEWTYLDPSFEDPDPQACHGRHELRPALDRQAQRGLKAELEEVVGSADRVAVVVFGADPRDRRLSCEEGGRPELRRVDGARGEHRGPARLA